MIVQYWVDEPANSGIFIRCADPESVNDLNSYEVNIYDTRADQTYRTGGIVHIAAPESVIDSPGRWNTYEIVARGSRLQVWLNGEQMEVTLNKSLTSLRYEYQCPGCFPMCDCTTDRVTNNSSAPLNRHAPR